MTLSDPIADLLTRIRNGFRAGHDAVEIPLSKVKKNIVEILKQEGFINDFMVLDDRKQGLIRVELKYFEDHRKSVITGIERVSKPGNRVYVDATSVPRILGGLGIAIVSTSQGLLTDREARKRKTGGEVLCRVW
mgnify:CR=1 FL=1